MHNIPLTVLVKRIEKFKSREDRKKEDASRMIPSHSHTLNIFTSQNNSLMHIHIAFLCCVTKHKLLSLSVFLIYPVQYLGCEGEAAIGVEVRRGPIGTLTPLGSGRLPDLSLDPRPTTDQLCDLEHFA